MPGGIQGVIGALVRGYSGVTVGPYVEVGDHFAVDLVIAVIFHIRENRVFCFPVTPARSAAEVVSVVLLIGRVSGRVRLYGTIFHLRDRGYGAFIVSAAGLIGQTPLRSRPWWPELNLGLEAWIW